MSIHVNHKIHTLSGNITTNNKEPDFYSVTWHQDVGNNYGISISSSVSYTSAVRYFKDKASAEKFCKQIAKASALLGNLVHPVINDLYYTKVEE